MTEDREQNLIDMNYRLLLLLGMVTPLLMDCKNSQPKMYHYKFDWFFDSLVAVVYENKPIPQFPENNLC